MLKIKLQKRLVTYEHISITYILYIINCKITGTKVFNSQDRKTRIWWKFIQIYFYFRLVLQKITKIISPINENNVNIKMKHKIELLD